MKSKIFLSIFSILILLLGSPLLFAEAKGGGTGGSGGAGSSGGNSSQADNGGAENSPSGSQEKQPNDISGAKMIDTNENDIPDGLEDWDSDGIPNKYDEDYAQHLRADEETDTNENSIPDGMEDWDGDGVINKDDEDYAQHLNADNAIDSNENDIPDGLEDWDEDGILNKYDPDYAQLLRAKNYRKYPGSWVDINANNILDGMEDWDEDKVSNTTDPDFENNFYQRARLSDLDENGIPDGMEDWDEDGILNKDDEDYERVLQSAFRNTRQLFSDEDKIRNREAVRYLQARGLLQGYPSGQFAPRNPVTRAEALKVILEITNENIETLTDTSFRDVKKNDWCSGYVQKAQEIGAVHGYTDGTFRPHAPINGAEFLKILFNALDVDIAAFRLLQAAGDPWYTPYLRYAAEHKLLREEQNTSFAQGTLSRDEFAAVMHRFLLEQEALLSN